MDWKAINRVLGNIDIYWLDFILKGYLSDNSKILDIGCGEGRNIQYLMQQKYDVFGVDIDPLAIKYIRLLAKSANLTTPESRFQIMKANKLLFPNDSFDVILSSAVLHFSESDDHFQANWNEMLRVLKPGGYLFVRTMTSHFLKFKDLSTEIGEDGIYTFPSGESRYLLSDEKLEYLISNGHLSWLEPSKYVGVSGNHSMGVFIMAKKIG